MGLLDTIIGTLQNGTNGQNQPVATSSPVGAVLMAIAAKALRQDTGGQTGGSTPTSGEPLDGLAGMFGNGGIGSLLTSLGGAGGLAALVRQFEQAGFGGHIASWVGNGPNQPIEPHEVEQALGGDAVNQLQQQTGLPRPNLLAELSRLLPQAIHELTPDGRLPSQSELSSVV